MGGALLLAGILLLGSLGGSSQPPSAAPTPVASASPTPGQSAASATRDPRAPIPAGYRIQIPRLGIDLPIAEGDVVRDIDQQKTPEGSAFHLPGTSIPGLGGNTYLYAHARTGMFLSLWNARPGDEVFISTPDLRALKYVISEVHPRVAPDDVSWVQPTNGERLTLQTSTGPKASDPRFVAIAVPATTP
ncbi:MAG TPA: sortase [Candidatus Limnocylindria bacterium]|nr:sortase [Candidatus Limnocylindria bacterium]